jgi:hypothetical protein
MLMTLAFSRAQAAQFLANGTGIVWVIETVSGADDQWATGNSCRYTSR